MNSGWISPQPFVGTNIELGSRKYSCTQSSEINLAAASLGFRVNGTKESRSVGVQALYRFHGLTKEVIFDVILFRRAIGTSYII